MAAYRQTVTISQNLRKRMEKVAGEVNWSLVAQQAFEKKLEGLAGEASLSKTERLERRLDGLQKQLDEIRKRLV